MRKALRKALNSTIHLKMSLGLRLEREREREGGGRNTVAGESGYVQMANQGTSPAKRPTALY